ncbi:MAG: phytanoyl-CoA dioxygenase family protein [Pseudomonadota bacterium]
MHSNLVNEQGALRLPQLVLAELSDWIRVTAPYFEAGVPGRRITDAPDLADLVTNLIKKPELTSKLGNGWRCVRAIAFDKSPKSNWTLGWHQDRTIAVKQRASLKGYDRWSVKDGIAHVEPPFELVERMVTLRVHLDRVDQHNGPLLVAASTHSLGRIAEAEIDTRVAASETLICEAEAGDAWLYATPILHASGRSTSPYRRRVLHLDYSKDALPPPLEWAGISHNA